MNPRILVLGAALLAAFALSACAPYAHPPTTEQALYGAWDWKSSSGGFTGKQVMTPETAGFTKRIRFTPEGEYAELHDGALFVEARYSLVRKRTIFGIHDVICFADSTGRLSDQVIMRLTATELGLSDPFPDGFGHTYVRAAE